MPFEQAPALPSLRPDVTTDLPTPPQALLGNVVGAAFRQENPLVSAYNALVSTEQFPPDPDYTPADSLRGTDYEARYAERFYGSRSEAETKSIMRRIDQEDADRRVLDAAGVSGVMMQMLAGTVDPTIALPAGAVVRAGRGGYSVGRSAASIGAAAGVQAAAQEAILQPTHETRSLGESALSIGAATLLGSFIGTGAASLLSRGERRSLAGALQSERTAMDNHAGNIPGAAAAAEVPGRSAPPPFTMEQLKAEPLDSEHFTRSQDGQRFVVGPKGSADLTTLPSLVDGVGEAPVRLRRGDMLHLDDKLHRGDAAEVGYRDGLHLTFDVLDNWQDIRLAAGERVMVTKPLEGGNAVAVVELARADGGDYWRIVSTGVRRDEQLGEVLRVRERTPETASGQQSPSRDRTLDAGSDDRFAQGAENEGNIVPPGDGGNVGLPRSGGAAAADTRNLELVSSGLGFSRKLSTTRRTLSAESITARRTMADLAETPYRFQENLEGVASTQGAALDRLARMEINGRRVEVSDELDRLFAEYRFGDGDKNFPRARATFERMIGRDGDQMTFSDFKREVALAMQDGDKHTIPQVAQAASFVRGKVFDPWKDRAIAAGLLDKDVDVRTAESYFQRLYNKEAIGARRPEFVDRVLDWLKTDQETKQAAKERLDFAAAQFRSWTDQVTRLEGRLERLVATQEKVGARLDERAMEVSRAERRSGVLEERAGAIADDLSEIGDFLDAMRKEIRDPELMLRLQRLEEEANALRRADRPMTEAQLRTVEDEELKSVLTGTPRMAAEMLVGRRSFPKTPSFASWLVAGGGVKDTGGDVASMLGGKRTRPGLLNNQSGRTLDEIAQAIREEAPGHFPFRDEAGHGHASHNEILDWIKNSLRGQEPDWWIATRSEGEKSAVQAGQMAAAMDEALHRAGVEVKNIHDVAKLMRDERVQGVSLADLDKITAEMEASGDVIPVSFRRAGVEEELAVPRQTVTDLRRVISQARSARESQTRRLRVAEARGDEAGIAAEANRGRLGVLQDRLDRSERRRELIVDTIEVANRMRDEVRAKIEAEIGTWEGKSASEAKSAIKSREKYAAETGRGPNEARLSGADDAVDRVVKRIIESDRELGVDELRTRANEITDRILSSPDGRLPYDIHMGGPEIGWKGDGEPPRGALARRDFAIPDATIRDFLEQDVEQVVATHLRTIVPDVLLTEKFGDVRMTDAFQRINEEYAARSSAAPSEKARKSLEAERQAVIRDIAAVRDRVRGVYGWSPDLRNMARVANGAKAINNLTSMGMSAISSLPDFAGAVFRHGFATTFSDGWAPYFKFLTGNLPEFDKFKTQMRAIGIGVETSINARQHALDDVMDVYRPTSRFERSLQAVNDKFFVANLLGPLTDFQKTVAAHVSVSEILRATKAAAAGNASKKQITNLAESGIDPQMAGRIWREFDELKRGEVVDGVHLPNTADWTDKAAAEALNGAVSREVDIMVVTPGQEKSLWMSHPVLSILGQFKAFTAASTERILVANLQRRDANTLSGLMFSISLGMLSYKINSMSGGQKTSDRPADWVKEGISRGGVLGWFEEGNALASKMTRGGVDVYRTIGADKPLSRFASRSTLDMFLGPTAGKITALSKVTGAAAARDWTEGDTTALRRLTVFQNLFYLRGLFNQAEEGFNDRFGIPMKAKP